MRLRDWADDVLEKAKKGSRRAGAKYVKRTPKPGGGYQYEYAKDAAGPKAVQGQLVDHGIHSNPEHGHMSFFQVSGLTSSQRRNIAAQLNRNFARQGGWLEADVHDDYISVKPKTLKHAKMETLDNWRSRHTNFEHSISEALRARAY